MLFNDFKHKCLKTQCFSRMSSINVLKHNAFQHVFDAAVLFRWPLLSHVAQLAFFTMILASLLQKQRFLPCFGTSLLWLWPSPRPPLLLTKHQWVDGLGVFFGRALPRPVPSRAKTVQDLTRLGPASDSKLRGATANAGHPTPNLPDFPKSTKSL